MTTAPAPELSGHAPSVTQLTGSNQAALTERLNDPAIVNALASLLDRADLIALLVDALDGLISRSEVIGNSLAGSFSELRSTVAGNEQLQKAGAEAPRILETASRLVSSDLLDPLAVDRISVLARGLVKGGDTFDHSPVQVGGALSLLRLLKDPDVNRAISYFATVAKAVGQEIASAPAARASTSSK